MCINKHFRTEGRRAFHPNKDPVVLNPYSKVSGINAHDLWLEGWRETSIKHEQKKLSILYNHVQCNVFQEYSKQTFEVTSCWELAQKLDDFRFNGCVCQDCIVYKYAKLNDEFDKQEIEKILRKRKILR